MLTFHLHKNLLLAHHNDEKIVFSLAPFISVCKDRRNMIASTKSRAHGTETNRCNRWISYLSNFERATHMSCHRRYSTSNTWIIVRDDYRFSNKEQSVSNAPRIRLLHRNSYSPTGLIHSYTTKKAIKKLISLGSFNFHPNKTKSTKRKWAR